jgi:acyl CoA:acetate/3-ketoacid CoA transferase beta subunit
VREGGLELQELIEGVSLEDVRARTAAPFRTT